MLQRLQLLAVLTALFAPWSCAPSEDKSAGGAKQGDGAGDGVEARDERTPAGEGKRPAVLLMYGISDDKD